MTEDLQLSAGFSLMRSRITRTDFTYTHVASKLGQSFVGNRFGNTPDRQASLAATWRWTALDLPRLSTSLGIVYVGQRWGDQGNTISLPGYAVVNLGADWQVNPSTNLGFFVGNLFDRTYYTAMQPYCDCADQVGVGDRRLMQASVRLRF